MVNYSQEKLIQEIMKSDSYKKLMGSVLELLEYNQKILSLFFIFLK